MWGIKNREGRVRHHGGGRDHRTFFKLLVKSPSHGAKTWRHLAHLWLLSPIEKRHETGSLPGTQRSGFILTPLGMYSFLQVEPREGILLGPNVSRRPPSQYRFNIHVRLARRRTGLQSGRPITHPTSPAQPTMVQGVRRCNKPEQMRVWTFRNFPPWS